jgi:hypothetical protein
MRSDHGGWLVRSLGVLLLIAFTVGACTGLASQPPSPSAATASPSPSSPQPSLGAATPQPTATPSRAPCGTLQIQVDEATAGSVLDLTGCAYESGATIDKALTVVGAEIRASRGRPAISVAADDVTLERMRLIGPDGRSYDDETTGISVQAGPGDPVIGLEIRNSEVREFSDCIRIRNVVAPIIVANTIEDCVYSGIMVLSSNGGLIENNLVRRIGVHGAEANDDNAYGIAVSHQLAGEPRSTDVSVHGNLVEDVPTWHALDTHGGQGISFVDNIVLGSSRAVFITGGVNGERATDIVIDNNLMVAPEHPTQNDWTVTTYNALDVAITRNTAVGWPTGHFFNDYTQASTGLTITANTIAG